MMRKLLTSFFLLFSFGAFAQITITQANMPQNGDTLRVSTAVADTSVLFNYTNNGANVTWKFDSLIPLRQNLREFKNSSQTPYGSVTNRIGELIQDTLALGLLVLYDVYDFYNSTSSSFSIDHRGASTPTGLRPPFPQVLTIANPYNDPDEIYQFPLDYLDRDSSTYEFIFQNALIGAYYGFGGYRINEVDAWGTLITPYDTFPNCLRVVTDIVGYDTVSFDSINFRIETHRRDYQWLSAQERIPALTLTGTVFGSTFIPGEVTYRDSVRDVPNFLAPLALFVAEKTNVTAGDTLNIRNFTLSLLPTTYEWRITPNTFSYLSGTSATSDSLVVAFQDSGMYDVRLIATNADGSDTLLRRNYIQVVGTVGVDELDAELDSRLSIYPNPINGGEQLIMGPFQPNELQSIEIYDLKGAKIYEEAGTFRDQYVRIDSPREAGTYYVRLTSREGMVSRKIVVTP